MEEREAFPKRPREETEGEEPAAEAKRHHHHHHSQQQRPAAYHHILSSLLEEEVAGGVADEDGEISSLMSALQQELSSDGLSPQLAALHSGEQAETGAGEEGCDAEGVMRRLLEASDDDLGIPPSGDFEGEEPAAAARQDETVRYGDREEEEEEKGGVLGVLGGGGLWVDNLDMDAVVAGYCSYDYYALLQPGLF